MSETSLQLFNGTNGTMCNETEMTFELMLTMSLPSQLISLFGLAGNGVVIWFLCFAIQRNPFTIYILNLAVADFLLLICANVALLYILINPSSAISVSSGDVLFYLQPFFSSGYNTRLIVLTFVSVERCVSVLHPLWYKCHRPTHLSTIVCVIAWAFAIFLMILECFVCTWEMHAQKAPQCTAVMVFLLSWSSGVFSPVMIISSLLMIITVKKSSQKNQPMRIYRVILLNVLIFLITTLVPKLLDNLYYFHVIKRNNLHFMTILYVDIFFSTLNSSANPYIYLLVGRSKKRKLMGSIKAALQRVFGNDYDLSCQHKTTNNRESMLGD